MRVLELTITDFRGIRHLTVKPDGGNLVIWGPNGSGKSAVVDALDFLLTGRISRLTGAGTKGITLPEYGPHIDRKESATAEVVALVSVPGESEPIRLRRSIVEPSNLEYDERFEKALSPLLRLARQGQHVLTRREILRFVTSEAGNRAQQIQEILDVTEIEKIRQALVSVRTGFKKNLEAAERALQRAEMALSTTAQTNKFDADAVLEVINRNRAVLDGRPITRLRSADLRSGVRRPLATRSAKVETVLLVEKDIERLLGVFSAEAQDEVGKSDLQLRTLLAEVQGKPELLAALSHKALINLGLQLVADDTAMCPLCEVAWEPGKLRAHLVQRSNTAGIAADYADRIDKLRLALAAPVDAALQSLRNLVPCVKRTPSLAGFVEALEGWLGRLEDFSNALDDVYASYEPVRFDPQAIKHLMSPEGTREILTGVLAALKPPPIEVSPQQEAWDTITRFDENLKVLEDAKRELVAAELSMKRAVHLHDAFVEARDKVLGELYDSIRDRFVALYQAVHAMDEGQFSAELKPTGPGLEFAVDFYGRGKHPPHALHSEGHQDSMGLCLYLALAERLTGGVIDLVILDDVVMSVDADHRREVCSLLARAFPDRQFLITTHDRTWACQLKSEGVVGSNGTLEFYNWSVDAGPQVNDATDLWGSIANELDKQDVSGASARLRRGSESFFGTICDALGCPVPYKISGRYELGDLLPAAVGGYQKLLKQAKKAANTWDDRDTMAELEDLSSTVSQIYMRTNAEHWGVNSSVHYSNWHALEVNDFKPVLEAFQDMHAVFICTNCGTSLRLSRTGLTPDAVRCSCGKVNWNLIEKR